MVKNVNNKKSEKPLSPNGLSQVGGGGSEPPLTHNKVDCAYLPNEMPSQNDNKINCHPGGFPVNCHPGGFPDGRRVNGSEPSPGSEQIEHTKTECPYAKLCEREGNPRQIISSSNLPENDARQERLSDSEHTKSSQDGNYGRFRMTNNPPQAGVRT